MPAADQRGAPGSAIPRSTVVLLTMAAAIVVVAGIKSAGGIIGPTFLALVLTIAAHPTRQRLQRHLPGWVANVVCVLVVYLLVLLVAMSLVVAGARFAQLLPRYTAEFDDLVAEVGELLQDLGVESGTAGNVLEQLDLGNLVSAVTEVLSGVLDLASNLVFVLALVLFMIIDGNQFPRLLARSRETRAGLVDALVGFAVSTRQYLRVSTVFGLIVAVLDTIALALLGVPAALLWGLVAFVTNYIPNIGFLIGLVPPAILGLLEGGPGMMLAVIVVYSVINVVIQSVIQPKVVGDAVGFSPTLTFLSLVFWAWVLGPLGAILAIPISLLVRSLLIDADPRSRWLAPLVANRGEDPAGATDAAGSALGGDAAQSVEPGDATAPEGAVDTGRRP